MQGVLKRMLAWLGMRPDGTATKHGGRGKKRHPRAPFDRSSTYWEERYAGGGDSGAGSYKHFATFKAEVLNAFVAEHQIRSVIEFGCGDGHQLTLASYPAYAGFDVSATAIARCRARFQDDPSKSFSLVDDYAGERAELALSLDVIFHLVEDDAFERYMTLLVGAGTRFMIVYASNYEDVDRKDGAHVKHRKFTAWLHERSPEWKLLLHVPNRYPYRGDYRKGSFSDFFIYQRQTGSASVPQAVIP